MDHPAGKGECIINKGQAWRERVSTNQFVHNSKKKKKKKKKEIWTVRW